VQSHSESDGCSPPHPRPRVYGGALGVPSTVTSNTRGQPRLGTDTTPLFSIPYSFGKLLVKRSAPNPPERAPLLESVAAKPVPCTLTLAVTRGPRTRFDRSITRLAGRRVQRGVRRVAHVYRPSCVRRSSSATNAALAALSTERPSASHHRKRASTSTSTRLAGTPARPISSSAF